MYIQFIEGSHFGVLDIIGSFIGRDKLDFNENDWYKFQDTLKRQFTVQCKEQSDLMTLPIDALEKMKYQFNDCYQDLF